PGWAYTSVSRRLARMFADQISGMNFVIAMPSSSPYVPMSGPEQMVQPPLGGRLADLLGTHACKVLTSELGGRPLTGALVGGPHGPLTDVLRVGVEERLYGLLDAGDLAVVTNG